MTRTLKSLQVGEGLLGTGMEGDGVSQRGRIVHYDGKESKMVTLVGTISMEYRGNTYYAPIEIFIPYEYPEAAPIVYVRPTGDMRIKRRHNHVDSEGVVMIPYLTSWERHVLIYGFNLGLPMYRILSQNCAHTFLQCFQAILQYIRNQKRKIFPFLHSSLHQNLLLVVSRVMILHLLKNLCGCLLRRYGLTDGRIDLRQTSIQGTKRGSNPRKEAIDDVTKKIQSILSEEYAHLRSNGIALSVRVLMIGRPYRRDRLRVFVPK